MNYKIENCKDGDAEYIIDRLVEYNLSQVPAKQEVLFDMLDKKITDNNGKIIAGCVAKMYCWNVAYIDTLWVDSEYRGKGLGARLLGKLFNESIKHFICFSVNIGKVGSKFTTC